MVDRKFSLSRAVQLAKLCEQSYAQYAAHKAGKSWSLPSEYSLIATLSAPYEGASVPIGFVARSGSDGFVVWRGTDNLKEWVQDAKFEQVACHYLAPPGGAEVKVELGFHELYSTGDKGGESASPRSGCLTALSELGDVSQLYITGHSLGGALAVLNALDIALNREGGAPVVYTFAGPRTGDHAFAESYDERVLNSWRVVNSHDEVPKLPPKSCPPVFHEYHYEHVCREYRITFGDVWDLPYDHSIDNYLSTLEAQLGGNGAN